MNTKSVKNPTYRIPSSKYWAQYWYPYPVGVVATLQLIMTFVTVSMEIGNAEVDLFRSNVYSGFWSFPFMISATIATYACVCTARSQTKAIIALILQIISIIVMLIVIGFLIAFISSNFTLCLGFQCSQSSSTSLSSSTYNTLKQAFIATEFVSSIIYIILSIIYIILFIKCYKKLPRIHPIVRLEVVQSAIDKRQLSNLTSTSLYWSNSTISYNRPDHNEQSLILSSSTISYNGAQKLCPNCQFVSPYVPNENIVECPSCKYQSPLVEHAQQC